MECLDDLTMLELATGMPEDRAEAIEQHLAGCASCRAAVAVLVQGRATTLPRESVVVVPEMWLAPGTRIGRYEVGECIGAGGMGVVYAARDPSLDRAIALKVVHGERPSARTRMSREAQAMARLSHPNVVTVHDVIEHASDTVIAMELVDGTTLAQWLEQPHGWAEIVDAFIQAGRGLAAAHAADLVHRDFKPSNVFVRADGRVQVGDFGLARLAADPDPGPAPSPHSSPLEAKVTEAGTVLGTPRYMAPEQRSGSADARSDQYSFCVSLDEALGKDRPAAFEPVLARGTAPDPAARYASMTELVDALAAARAQSLPAQPRPRRRAAIALVSGLAIAGGAIGGAALAGLGPFARTHEIAATVAISPFAIDAHVTGAVAPDPKSLAATLAQTLTRIDGARLSGIVLARADSAPHADFTLGGRIDENEDGLVAQLELVRVATGEHTSLRVASSGPSLGALVSEIARQVGRSIAPGSTLPARHDRVVATQLYERATQLIRTAKFNPAQIALEEAVEADPSHFESWRELVFVRSWLEASPASIRETVESARRVAPPSQLDLMDGIAAYCDVRFDEARAALERAERATDDPSLQLAIQYYRGEVEWHDGHYLEGYRRFERTLQLDREFGPSGIHMFQYALARRDVATASLIVGVAGDPYLKEQVEAAAGHYEALAATGSPLSSANAMLVLGRQVPDERALAPRGGAFDRGIYPIARALEDGDRARAQAAFTRLWQAEAAGHALAAWQYSSIVTLGEVLVAGELAAEAQQVVAMLAEASRIRPVPGYHRIALLTAALANTAPPPLEPLTFRERRLAAALAAEHAGDRAAAAAALAELVADPSSSWDYPERAALVRNLRALGRTKEIAALCEDTLRPPIFRDAYLVLRGECKR